MIVLLPVLALFGLLVLWLAYCADRIDEEPARGDPVSHVHKVERAALYDHKGDA